MVSLQHLFFAVFVISIAHHATGKKFFAGGNRDAPPAHNEIALMARYIVHNADWVSVGTISVTEEIKGYPFVGLKSMSDGPLNKGTGVPYMFMTDMDVSMNDINHDNRCTLFMSLAQGDYCKGKEYDPQDPRCARVMLTGSIDKLEKDCAEDVFARSALFARHPAMTSWPLDHNFFVAKLNIAQISVIDFFGGIKHVTPKEYYAAQDSKATYLFDRLINDIEVVQIKF